jgi:hypothetical protein
MKHYELTVAAKEQGVDDSRTLGYKNGRKLKYCYIGISGRLCSLKVERIFSYGITRFIVLLKFIKFLTGNIVINVEISHSNFTVERY